MSTEGKMLYVLIEELFKGNVIKSDLESLEDLFCGHGITENQLGQRRNSPLEVFKEFKKSCSDKIKVGDDGSISLIVGGPIKSTNTLCPLLKAMAQLEESESDINDPKHLVARYTAKMLADPQYHSMYFTLGSTIYLVAKYLAKERSFRNRNIYTNNLPVLCALGPCIENITVKPLLSGQLLLEKWTAYDNELLEHIKKIDFKTVVCSFSEVSYEDGFYSKHDQDRGEKKTNILDNNAENIIIPLSWEKFGNSGVQENRVAIKNDLCLRKADYRGIEKKYKFIINGPKEWKDWVEGRVDSPCSNQSFAYESKKEEYDKWKDWGVEIDIIQNP